MESQFTVLRHLPIPTRNFADSTLPELDRLAFFARDDVSKFGAVMKNVGAANETYSELVSKVTTLPPVGMLLDVLHASPCNLQRW